MATVKTAISLPEDLSRSLDEYATETTRARSAIVVEALRKFFYGLETKQMAKQLEEVYGSFTPEEREAERAELEAWGGLSAENAGHLR